MFQKSRNSQMKPQHKGIYTELPMGFKIDHSKTKLLGVQCYGPDGKPSFFIPNKLDNMNTQDNKVFKLYIKKTHPKESGTYTNFEVGQSVTALEEYIRKTYKVDVLIKDPEDDFPYFTDGGFKYTAKGDYWHYEFTCYPDNLILASHSVSEGGEKRWYLRVKDPIDSEPVGHIGYYNERYDGRSPSETYKWFETKPEAEEYWEKLTGPKVPSKPPIGVIPEWLWKEKRLEELRAAIKRYAEANIPIGLNWITEEYLLREWLDEYHQSKIKGGE